MGQLNAIQGHLRHWAIPGLQIDYYMDKDDFDQWFDLYNWYAQAHHMNNHDKQLYMPNLLQGSAEMFLRCRPQ